MKWYLWLIGGLVLGAIGAIVFPFKPGNTDSLEKARQAKEEKRLKENEQDEPVSTPNT